MNVNSSRVSAHSSTESSVDLRFIGVFCGACKAGFASTAATTFENGNQIPVPNMISACTAIENCEHSEWFNACTQCQEGYSHSYSALKGVQYDTCVSYENQDCLAVNQTDECVFCKPGSYLNKDGYCERIQPPRCEHKQFVHEQKFYFRDIATGLWLNKEGTGCLRCDEGFTGLLVTENHYACTESIQHSLGAVADGTNYIQNCKNYYLDPADNILKCHICEDDFIPLQSGGSCTATSSLPNCKVAQNSQFCAVCEDEYVLVSRVCELKSIEHCIEYQNDENSSQQICSDCGPGYYREANACHPGEVKNCYLFETKHRCNVCDQGFALVFQNNGYNYCYPINPQLKCAVFNPDKFQGAHLECVQCVDRNFVIQNESFYRSICMRYFEIPNCQVYDVHPAIADSSFQCLRCQPNFFLRNNVCEFRLNEIDFCVEQQVDDDLCSRCDEEHYLSSDKRHCEPNPTGIRGCRVYTSTVDCSACEANLYLQENTCVALLEEELIDNCVFYQNQFNCERCGDGFLVQNGVCESTSLQNCALFAGPLICEKCIQGYGFKDVEGTPTCVQKSVDNCTVSEDFDPFNCLVCANGHYVNEGACAQVTDLILNCVEYAGIDVCSKCSMGTALSIDGKTCYSSLHAKRSIDAHCLSAEVVDTPICNTCEPGFYFSDGECVECGEPNGLSNGCYNCDAVDPSVCLICKPGYYMTKTADCVKFGEETAK